MSESVRRSVGRSIHPLEGRSVGRLVGWSVGWFDSRSVGRSVSQSQSVSKINIIFISNENEIVAYSQ